MPKATGDATDKSFRQLMKALKYCVMSQKLVCASRPICSVPSGLVTAGLYAVFDTCQLMRWCCTPLMRSRCKRTIVGLLTYMVLLEELMRRTGVD